VVKKSSKKKEQIKAELYNELRNELASKEFVRAEINEVRSEIKQNNLLLKVLIALALFGLTIFNPKKNFSLDNYRWIWALRPIS